MRLGAGRKQPRVAAYSGDIKQAKSATTNQRATTEPSDTCCQLGCRCCRQAQHTWCLLHKAHSWDRSSRARHLHGGSIPSDEHTLRKPKVCAISCAVARMTTDVENGTVADDELGNTDQQGEPQTASKTSGGEAHVHSAQGSKREAEQHEMSVIHRAPQEHMLATTA